MKCSQCIKEGKTSNVYPGGGYETMMYCPPYFDKDGKHHIHDMNTTTWSYECSNGHKWTKSERKKCPTCGDNW